MLGCVFRVGALAGFGGLGKRVRRFLVGYGGWLSLEASLAGVVVGFVVGFAFFRCFFVF